MKNLHFRTRFFFISFLMALSLGTIGFIATEDLSIGDALYFSIVTIATVGYGDIHPETQSGKIIAIFMIVIGTGTFLGVIANVTEIILNKKEHESRMEKINMVIGLFFSELGIKLLTLFSGYDPHIDRIQTKLVITEKWDDNDFLDIVTTLNNYHYEIDVNFVNFTSLRTFLISKRDVLVRLLEHPILLEHGSFTDLLRAVFHLTEELGHRENTTDLLESDTTHLIIDIIRSYNLLVCQWLDYMRYLKNNYPYLFSLAMRTNPFDKNASPIVK